MKNIVRTKVAIDIANMVAIESSLGTFSYICSYLKIEITKIITIMIIINTLKNKAFLNLFYFVKITYIKCNHLIALADIVMK